METTYYSEFSQQRADLRKEWNGTKTDWEVCLQDANLKALKVADALNKNIDNFSHLEIVENYNSLYNAHTENNKIIAEFMGYKQLESYSEDIKLVSYRIEKEGKRIGELTSYTKYKPEQKENALFRLWNQLNLVYHSDWNSLMEVVEKIENIRHSKDINSMRFDFQIKHHSAWINDCEIEGKKFIYCGGYHSKILAAYDAIIYFVRWYNENYTKDEA